MLRRAEALAAIVDTRRTVAISGTHGKTTTSTMTTLILRAAGWQPVVPDRRRAQRGRQ